MNPIAAPCGWESLKELAVSETGFIFDPRTGFTFQVNNTGRFLLNGLQRGCTLSQLEQELLDAFEVQGDDLQRDIMEFLYLLKKHELLREDC